MPAHVPLFKMTVDPTVNDDETLYYRVGYCWINENTNVVFECTSAAAGSAVWEERSFGTVVSISVSSSDLMVMGSPITTSGTFILNINNGAVTLVKMANLSANTIIGNNTMLSTTPLALTPIQVTAMLDVFTSLLKGLVPASGGGTTNFLRADGTWSAPPPGTVTSVGVSSTDFSVSGSPITTNGTIILNLNVSAVTPDTYGRNDTARVVAGFR